MYLNVSKPSCLIQNTLGVFIHSVVYLKEPLIDLECIKLCIEMYSIRNVFKGVFIVMEYTSLKVYFAFLLQRQMYYLHFIKKNHKSTLTANSRTSTSYIILHLGRCGYFF